MKSDNQRLPTEGNSVDNSSTSNAEEANGTPCYSGTSKPGAKRQPSAHTKCCPNCGTTQNDDDRLLSIAECGKIAGGKHSATIYRWAKAGGFSIENPGPNSSGVWKSAFMHYLRSRPPRK